MKLSIQNLAKIKCADIELNGITVIAGDNDTGKSTVGKVLYSVFSSYHLLPYTVKSNRGFSAANVVINVLSDAGIIKNIGGLLSGLDVIAELSQIFANEPQLNIDAVLMRSNEFIKNKYGVDIDADYIEDIKLRLKKIFDITDAEIACQIVGTSFNRVFQNQTNSLQHMGNAEVDLRIKGRHVHTLIQNNICEKADADVLLLRHAIYLDNPFVLDRISSGMMGTSNDTMRDLLKRLSEVNKEDVLNSIINKKSLDKVMRFIDKAVQGEFDKDDNNLVLKRAGWKEPLNVANLSAGVKAFAVLKLLIQNNQLGEKDVLILDEPEIHLHPEWQVLYAEFLVLFQKAFDLTILLTTHSPYFLNAIEVFARKYDRLSNVNYYQTKIEEDNMVTLVDVTNNLDEIYGSMAAPFNKLSEMEQELGM